MKDARIHNACLCTFDNRDHFIASFRDADNRLQVEGFDTPEQAREWLIDQARLRAVAIEIIVEDRPNAPVKFR